MKNFYFVFLLLLGISTFSTAQTASSYYFKHKTGVALEEMSGATSLVGENADGVQLAPVAFFPFTFAGVSYNTFSVSEDGVVVLGNAAYAPYPYDNYFSQSYGYPAQVIAPVYPILLPWGEDLFTAADGGITYKITGAAPSRKLVIEFKAKSAEDGTGNYDKTFQVWLLEDSHTIQYVYGNCAAAWYNNANIGIASSATDYLSVDAATNTVSSTVVSINNGSFTEPSPLPVSGTAYVFSPTEIMDVAPAPVVPVSAVVAMQPEYPVAGQQRHTIYLGYGVQAVTLEAKASGGNPPATGYIYAWSPATGLSHTAVAAPTASPVVTTTYTVTVSDGNNNSTTQSITVYVIDPRMGDKFKMCKQGKTIIVSKEAVEAQLQGGATLGDCSSVAGIRQAAAFNANVEEKMMQLPASSGLAVYPNPSAGVINVRLAENAQERTVEVLDFNGRVVVLKSVSEKEQTIQFDLTSQPRGIYMVRSISNGRIQTSKLIIR